MGKSNFNRAIKLAGELVEVGVVLSVSRASRKQDKKGIDFFCLMPGRGEDQVVKVPVQVKSSAKSAQRFREMHSDEILTIVVNDYRSDDDIKANLSRNLVRFIVDH
ncbi:hypothetical protein HY405_01475 [Candidatus Microgenomates bacterium]|nr:hypothetical protein [Candidatus Microgenomates bacterium]